MNIRRILVAVAVILTTSTCSGGSVSVGVGMPSIPPPTSPEPVTSTGVIGPVEAIDANLGQMVVTSQRTLTDDRTEFGPDIDPISLGGIAVGDTPQISGFTTTNSDLAATRVELVPRAAQVQIAGEVLTVDIANMLFAVNNLLIDYRNARVIVLQTGIPLEGTRLAVGGHLVSATLVADELRAADDLVPGTPYRRVNVRGNVTQFHSASDFQIDGHPITTDWDTDYSGGSASDIQPDVEVTIDGRISGDGRTILADEIDFRRLPVSATTLTYDVGELNEITVFSVFDLIVTQAEEYAVVVTIDEDLVNSLVVTRNGNSLDLGLQSGEVGVQTIRAGVRMPVLNRIALDGVIRATIQAFDQYGLDVILSGVSLLRSEISTFTNVTASQLGVCSFNFGDGGPTGTAAPTFLLMLPRTSSREQTLFSTT